MATNDTGNEEATKAEICFESFPCGSCAAEADRALKSIDGVAEIIVDPAVRRIAVYFDPERVGIPLILSALEPFGARPKVVSVVSRLKGVV
jgi:copper chaperone CopZ